MSSSLLPPSLPPSPQGEGLATTATTYSGGPQGPQGFPSRSYAQIAAHVHTGIDCLRLGSQILRKYSGFQD